MRTATRAFFAVSVLAVGLLVGAPSGAAVTTYTTQVLPTPPGTGYSALFGISCPSTGNCVAVGNAQDNGFTALAETLTGGKWSSAAIGGQGLMYPELYGVWCANVTSCIAVGSDGPIEPNGADALIETLAHGIWTDTTAGLNPVAGVTSTLDAISCISITSCVATGSYGDGNGDSHALFETLSGGVWTPSSSADPNGSTSVDVDSVQCFSGSSCVAVGQWAPNSATSNGLLETLSGSTWTASTLQEGVTLRSLQCDTAASCLAVGYTTTGTSAVGVTASLSGTHWTFGSLPLPAGGTGNGINALSCTPTITSCVAIGGWRDSSDPFVLIESLSGGVWTPTVLSPPQGLVFPTALSCPTITSCVGVGESEGVTTSADAIIESVPPPSPPPSVVPHGYWLVGSDGGIFSFGAARFHGSTGADTLNRPVVGITPTINEGGYWLVASDGGIFSFGNAGFFGSIPGLGLGPAGSTGGKHLNAPIVGMVPSFNGRGYFMVAADGGVFAFGDATFEGSCPGIGGCSGSAVGVAPDATGHGYWLVTSSGHVYTFGDARYFGAPGPQSTAVTSIVRTPDGKGYWVLDGRGNVFGYGDALFHGGVPGGAAGGTDPASAIFSTSDGGGYWIVTSLGEVYAFGDAPNDGGMSGTHLNGSIIAATGF
jgi:hypothetical protein